MKYASAMDSTSRIMVAAKINPATALVRAANVLSGIRLRYTRSSTSDRMN
ncbi:MAG: hypothetical protein LBS72_04185 [Oscillospiraceae bacterium]|nr:hypothetical protein [Oscillospiraceae bacterium]